MRIRSGVNSIFLMVGPLILTVVSGVLLSSSWVGADEGAYDRVHIDIPVNCSLLLTENSAHTATISGGIYQTDIGESTIKAICNDREGFSIYAVGYTNDTDGNNVLSSSFGSEYDIASGTATSGATSNWAMKISAVAGTYTPTINTYFSNYNIVPPAHVRVAYSNSSTDATNGASIKSTYAVYVSPTQPYGSYDAKVRYILVHPNYLDYESMANPVTVVFNGNGLTFSNNQTTNTVQYARACQPDGYGYISYVPTISKTENILDDGTMDEYNTSNEDTEDILTFSGATKLKVKLTYGFDWDGELTVFYDGDHETGVSYRDFYASSSWEDENDNKTVQFVLESDSITFYTHRYGAPESNYYGYYAQVYPIYDTEQPNTVYDFVSDGSNCSVVTISGSYQETVPWKGYWIDESSSYYDESDIIEHILYNKPSSMALVANNPYTVTYDDNGATVGSMSGFSTEHHEYSYDDSIQLLSPNYYKTGYGFAGWSSDSSAQPGGSSTIYGPNEKMDYSDLTYDSTRSTTLYPVWVASSGSLQGWTGCNSLSAGGVTALTDTRDNNTYAVAKLADGKCWMIENLRLDAQNSLDSSKAQGYGGAFTGLAESEDTNFQSVVSNSRYDTSIIVGNNQRYRFPRYNNQHIKIGGSNSSGESLIADPFHRGDDQALGQWYSYGNYYTFAAAIADTTDYTTDIDITSTSICPSGWHLPNRTESGNLNVSFGGSSTQATGIEILREYLSYPNNFVFSGYREGSWNRDYGYNHGFYWLAASNSNYRGYIIYLEDHGGNSAYVHPVSSGVSNKDNGYTIRCVAN